VLKILATNLWEMVLCVLPGLSDILIIVFD